MMFCVTAWILVSIASIWASVLFFVLFSSPNYLYMSTSSRTWLLSLISDFFPFPILTVLHLAAPNSVWYFCAACFVMSIISCSVLRS